MTDYRKNGSAVGGGGGGGMENPMTTVGDIVVGDTVSGGVAAPARLGAGASGYILRSVAGTPAWRELSAAGLGSARPNAVATREGQTYWSTDAAAGSELAMVVHKGGTTYDWEILAYGAPGLPVASGAGEVPLSTGAGTTYVAANFGDEVGAAVGGFIGAVSGQTFIGDGAGEVATTSADVSGFLAAADAAAARAALGAVSAPTSGTLAARAASPAAGDAYAVTSGVASGDRYTCFVAGSWSLVSYDRRVGVGAPYLQWLLDEAAGTYAQTGSATGGTLTVTGTVAREAPGLLGENAARFTAPDGQYAEGGASLTPPSGAFSVSVWVKPDLIGSVEALFVKPFASSGWLTPFASVYLYLQASGRVRCGVTIAGSPVDLSPASGPIAVVAQWSQVAMVWDGAGSPKLSLYLNGELVGSSSPAGTAVDWNTDGAWSVSNSRAADGVYGVFGGARVWSVALTAAQVREDFRRGAGIYRGQ